MVNIENKVLDEIKSKKMRNMFGHTEQLLCVLDYLIQNNIQKYEQCASNPSGQQENDPGTLSAAGKLEEFSRLYNQREELTYKLYDIIWKLPDENELRRQICF
jgi:hypothetical protein